MPDFSYIALGLVDVLSSVDLLIQVLIAVALLLFLWGLVVFISKSGDAAAQESGKRKMFWGIITLFVMVAVWGIVTIVQILFLSGADYNPPPRPELLDF
jgi:hypothetical protein